MAKRNGMVNALGTFIGLAALVYVVLGIFLYLMQSRVIFYPNLPGRELRASPADIGLDYEEVWLRSRDGVRIHGWFVKSARNRGTVIFLHGNAGNISHRLDSLRIFNHLGLSSLIIDYRGYGQSQGQITEEGMYLDAEAAWQYLAEERELGPERIIIFGRSLGGAIAANLAAKKRSAGLILESAFTSVPDMAAKMYPIFPVRFLCRYQYNARKTLQQVNSPVLIIHSPDDEIIPFVNGEELFGAANEPKSFLQIRGSHNEGFIASGPKYYEGLDVFVTGCLQDSAAKLQQQKKK